MIRRGPRSQERVPGSLGKELSQGKEPGISAWLDKRLLVKFFLIIGLFLTLYFMLKVCILLDHFSSIQKWNQLIFSYYEQEVRICMCSRMVEEEEYQMHCGRQQRKPKGPVRRWMSDALEYTECKLSECTSHLFQRYPMAISFLFYIHALPREVLISSWLGAIFRASTFYEALSYYSDRVFWKKEQGAWLM